MPHIVSIFTHFSNQQNSLTCIQRLAEQLRRPDNILIINNCTDENDDTAQRAHELATQLMGEGILHIIQMESNLGNAGGCARGLDYAFHQLKADFVWVLDDDSWPRAESLAALCAQEVNTNTIRMSMVIDPSRGDELSWPLSCRSTESEPWQHIAKRKLLPSGNIISSRGGWLGALYPRAAWQRAGLPTEELFIRGEDEEYPWKLRHAGFNFITLRNSPLEHPSSKGALIEYRLPNGHSFFYEPGLHISRVYYKNRNWAWLQRLAQPRLIQTPLRLLACGAYIACSLSAMIYSNEMGIKRIYQLFRALHNGFYGKLRPY